MRLRDALSSHSDGFYEEIDKLAKGKALFTVTDLVVAQANDIIRDAKKIAKYDVYLNRTTEFVPAGDNPTYPDVLVSIRGVRDGLERRRKELRASIDRLPSDLQRANTLVGALEYFLDDTVDDDADKNFPTKEAVQSYVIDRISTACFTRSEGDDEYYFDFFRLDQQTVDEFLSLTENDDGPPGSADTLFDAAEESPADESGDEADKDKDEDDEE
jgi:hypothetical protein